MPPKLRVTFIDWLRGLAAVIMLQGHTFDAFLRPADRSGAWFTYSQFFGGEAAAIFLFLTGATYGMGMNRREHMPPGARVLQALKRARFLFILAILFLLQGWIFAWGAFLAFGVGVGSMIQVVERGAWNRVMQWSALVGFGLLFGGRYFAD